MSLSATPSGATVALRLQATGGEHFHITYTAPCPCGGTATWRNATIPGSTRSETTITDCDSCTPTGNLLAGIEQLPAGGRPTIERDPTYAAAGHWPAHP